VNQKDSQNVLYLEQRQGNPGRERW